MDQEREPIICPVCGSENDISGAVTFNCRVCTWEFKRYLMGIPAEEKERLKLAREAWEAKLEQEIKHQKAGENALERERAEWEKQRDEEIDLWKQCLRINTSDSMNNYLGRYTQGRFAGEAQQILHSLEVTCNDTSTNIQERDLQKLVESTAPGSEIRLGEGTYTLALPLKITKSLSISGLGEMTRILCMGDGYGLAFLGGSFTLRNLVIQHVGDSWANVVHVHRSEFHMADCRISGGKAHDRLNLITSSFGEHITAGNGMLVYGKTSGIIKNNVFEYNDRSGIDVIGNRNANLLVEGNTCSNNKGSGVSYWLTKAGSTRGNTCQGNGASGIDYLGDFWNANDNIWVCEGNHCEGNGGDGISLSYASLSVERNICRRNNGHGIAYSRFCGGIAKGNTCEDNEGSGIFIGRDQMGRVPLEGNFCQGNKRGDILDERKTSWWKNVFRK